MDESKVMAVKACCGTTTLPMLLRAFLSVTERGYDPVLVEDKGEVSSTERHQARVISACQDLLFGKAFHHLLELIKLLKASSCPGLSLRT